jgi:ABC-2 type transport system ATP-binding protein
MQSDLSTPVMLSLRGLQKAYGDVRAVNGLSLDVHRGEILGLLGPNGAGKTTTLHIVCGLLQCDSGEVWIDGHLRDEGAKAAKGIIGLCPQNVVIWETLTCLEQLELVGRLYDLPAAEARERSMELLAALGLCDKKDKLARTLSGGMKRRLNIALALVHDPPVVILDEPQAELDPQSRIVVREYIRGLRRAKTVILSTHDMDEADRLSDRVAIIDHGRLLVLDTPEGLKKRIGAGDALEIGITAVDPDRLKRFMDGLRPDLGRLTHQDGTLRLVGVDAPSVLPELLQGIRDSGLQMRDIAVRKKTLEDVFIALTGRRLRE